jgi:hypothetical protein
VVAAGFFARRGAVVFEGFSLAAAFFAFDFAAVGRGLLAGGAAGLGGLPAAPEAGMSTCFSDSILDFLATFF